MGPFQRGRSAPFRRREDQIFDVNLDEMTRRLLGQLLGQMRDLLTTDSSALVRLFPPPYGDDEERNQGYAVLAGAELFEARLAAIDAVESQLDAVELDQEQLETWMRAVNDIRLVLGTILDVDEDTRHVDPADEDAATHAAYELLGVVLENIVWALSE